MEKHFISHVLAFFAASDGIVLENLAVRFMSGQSATPHLLSISLVEAVGVIGKAGIEDYCGFC